MGWTIFYFFIALLLLITVHEFGHFIVARACGVKVLRFSFGFGKVLASFRDKKGTEYALSLVPMGGYVKMLDEREEAVLPEEAHLAFNRQSLIKRIAIVAAGPIFNLLFAILALWLALMIGIYSLAPVVDEVTPNSIAAKAGFRPKDEVLSIDATPIRSLRDIQYVLMPYVGTDARLQVEVVSVTTAQKRRLEMHLQDWTLDPQKPDLLKSLGIVPFIPKIPPIIDKVMPDSAAALASLKKGDKILSLNHMPINDWTEMLAWIAKRPNEVVRVEVLREGKPLVVSVRLGEHQQGGQRVGLLGVLSQKIEWSNTWFRLERLGPLEAFQKATVQTFNLTQSTFILMGRLFTGQLDLKSISGPVGIAEGAGDSARHGIAYYLSFLALVSISLAVLNLLPIPMLDGGHLLFYFIEALMGRAVPERVQSVGAGIGMVFLLGLMVLALANDFARISAH